MIFSHSIDYIYQARIMNEFKEFLESSTIHGLVYISKTKKFTRICWTLVVITGFIVAWLLIGQSFDQWKHSPVSTTIETLPIDEVNFPKITVCPPQNTFTNLNYDLSRTGDVDLEDSTRSLMVEIIPEIVFDSNFAEKYSDFLSYQEKDRFRNWYFGHTEISVPFWNGDNREFELITFTVSGQATTPSYGQTFVESQFAKNLDQMIRINIPESVYSSQTGSLNLKIETDTMESSAYETVRQASCKYTVLSSYDYKSFK